MKRKIYLETSVISYLTARPSKTIIGAAHQQITASWWEARGEFELFVSDVVLDECADGNTEAAQRRANAIKGIPLLEVTASAVEIARELISRSIVPKKAAQDALHIAVATIHGMDCLLTWNCRHIANIDIQRNVAHYLESVGLLLPIMCTPEELLGGEDDEGI
ncbi:MAG: type II toxin-antitoxin system VapC family toxin [Rhodoferax sp.]|nr:type II toxin-antitoxin system VapC family toxin [Rhodoferax sp.]